MRRRVFQFPWRTTAQIDRDVEAASADSPKKLESFAAKRAG